MGEVEGCADIVGRSDTVGLRIITGQNKYEIMTKYYMLPVGTMVGSCDIVGLIVGIAVGDAEQTSYTP